MGKVIVYIASSLDGYVAAKDDGISWLEKFNVEGEDHGYAAFIRSVGAAVMGARTYAQSLLHPERLMRGIRNYVLSSSRMEVPEGLDVTFWDGGLPALVTRIRKEDDRDIFVVGGGQTVTSFLEAGLVDRLRHFVAPILIGDGIPLYGKKSGQIALRLEEARSYRTGIVELSYAPAEGSRTT